MTKYIEGNIRAFDRKVAEETRTVQFVISSDTKDRHRSVVNMEGWQLERFNMNPIIGYQHNVYGGNMCTPDDPDDVIGSGRAWIEEVEGRKLLIGEVKFEPAEVNPKAEKIFRKVLNGSLRATSVGFMELGQGEWKRELDANGKEIDRTYFFKGQELLEFSIVNIPSNPDAVSRSMAVQQEWAMAYIMRFMPEDVSMKQVKEMKVGDVLSIVEKKIKGDPEPVVEQENEDFDPARYRKRLQLNNYLNKNENG